MRLVQCSMYLGLLNTGDQYVTLLERDGLIGVGCKIYWYNRCRFTYAMASQIYYIRLEVM